MNNRLSRLASRSAAMFSVVTSSCLLALPAFASSNTTVPLSVDAIIGTGKDVSTNAIIGTGKDASTNAIIGTGKDVSANAIIGTGKDASTNAIIGTGRHAIESVALVGPIEAVNLAEGTFTVHTRQLRFAGNNALAGFLSTEIASGSSVQAIVVANLGKRGELLDPVVLFSNDYVSGLSEVVVSGRVTSLDATRGFAKLGAITFDFTQLLSKQEIEIRVGAVVRVRGTQPQSGQMIIATQIEEVSSR